MAIIKCKMCGGDIALNDEKTFGTCEYCGSTMTLPKVSDEQRAALFNRGNHFRRIGEFDKALAIYENIVREDDTDAEAHWCCALCRFGIEYVEDPATYEYIPTCHRASFDSFLEDVDYLAALDNSDGITKRQYQKDAVKIAEVQKGILATSQNEEPFDVFICYKETDDTTKERTKDSIDAQEIYYQLTNEGYRVFFSRITLEDKAGAEYEPYIFAALNSAKVMVVLGSKPEYFNAVWVKNEWNRFLALMRKDRSKILLPCYKSMDPYDLPEQLSVLQSYDMTKIGFMQDLIRGINKLIFKSDYKPEAPKTTPQIVQQVVSGGPSTESLLKRAYLFLEEGEFAQADEYFNKVLDIDPENDEAYIGLMLKAAGSITRADYEQGIIDGKFREDRAYNRAKRFAKGNNAAWFEKLELERAEVKARREMLYRLAFALNSYRKEKERMEAKERAEKKRREAKERAEKERREAEERAEKERPALERAKIILKPVRERLMPAQKLISAGGGHAVGLKADGTVVATKYTGDPKYYSGQCEVSSWRDIVAVSAGYYQTVGLKVDGTVVATKYTGDPKYYSGQCEVSSWQDIVAISAGSSHTVGLKADGTVVATKYTGDPEDYSGQCEVSSWRDIVAISAGSNHTVGLKADGTVVACGDNLCGRCNVSDWRDIVAISAGYDHTVGLKADGTVVACGDNLYGQCNVSDWRDIVAVSARGSHTVGLKADGTVIAVGFDYDGRCNVSDWRDIVAVSARGVHTVGLKADGTVIAVGFDWDYDWDWVFSGWKLFNSFDKLEEKRKEAAERAELEEKERIEAAERAEKERKEAAERAEKERKDLLNSLTKRKAEAETELANLKGLFTGKRRKELEAELVELNKRIAALQKA